MLKTQRMYRSALLIVLLLSSTGQASQDGPAVAIIIDDIGYRIHDDRQALALPGPFSYAVLPHTPGADEAIHSVRESNRDLILHMPMEKLHPQNKAEVPGTLRQDMSQARYIRTIHRNIAAVPDIIAVNNHEGSRLTANTERMRWLMKELASYPHLAFIDSRTTRHTVALSTARQYGLITTHRDVFLDHEPEKIQDQFDLLIETAKRNGTALGVAHPHKETIRYLRSQLPALEQHGVHLIPVSELLKRQQSVKTGRTHAKGIDSTR